MSIRNYRIARRGPSWAEVILGAVLSLILGVAVGALMLAFRPVMAGKELPPESERKAGEIYYVEGSRDAGKGRLASNKKKAFLEGQTVTLSEDELNVMAGPAPVAKPATPAPKKAAPAETKAAVPKTAAPKSGAAEPEVDSFARGTPNFRLREDDVQIAVPITVNVLGLGSVVTVRTHGQVSKQGDVFRYEIRDMYVGALHVQRLPFVGSWAREKFMTQPLPEDLEKAWAKLAKVTVTNGSVQLAMP